MRLAWIWRHPHPYDYVLTNTDGHFATFAYLARYYDVRLFLPTTGPSVDFVRDGYRISLRSNFADLLPELAAFNPDAVTCYGPIQEQEWPAVRAAVPGAFFALDYAGGPLHELDGTLRRGAELFDVVFTAHDTQAEALRAMGVRAIKARGVDCERFRPSGWPKAWRVIVPANFTPLKRQPLVAEALERYGPDAPSLFCGAMESIPLVEMTRVGGIPTAKNVPRRHRIEFGGRACYPSMPMLYGASQVCVVGSQEEGGPWAALEAMACGTPAIVLSDCEWGVADAFAALAAEYPGACLVVPPAADAIHRGIEALIGDPDAPRAAREAILDRYNWWGMYSTIDQTLKNEVGFRQSGKRFEEA